MKYFIYTKWSKNKKARTDSVTVRMPELALFLQREFFQCKFQKDAAMRNQKEKPPIDGKVALSVCRCVGNFQNKIIFFLSFHFSAIGSYNDVGFDRRDV